MIHMKYIATQDYSFLLDENHYVYDHVEDEDSLHIYIKSKEHGCKCPLCEKMSTKLHATYRKKKISGYPNSLQADFFTCKCL